MVSRKLSSVSPGKPTITSTPIQASGLIDLICAIRFAKSSLRYLRRIFSKISSEPLCNGIWKCGAKRVALVRQKSMISLESRLGSIEDILNRSIPSILSSAFVSSKKFSSLPCPKSPILTPVRTTSLTSVAAIFLASIMVWAMLAFLLFPRANGMVQKVQK